MQQRIEGVGLDRPGGRAEALDDVAPEGLGRDDAQLDGLGAAPERLVLVAEEPAHHVALAAEVHVRHLGLGLEDGAHQPRQGRVDVDDLLELVEDQRHAAPALGAELARQRQQVLERRAQVLGAIARVEAEGQLAGVGVDVDGRLDAQRPEDPQAVERLLLLGGDVLVDRARELLGQLGHRRRRHEIDGGDEHLAAHELLGHPPHQRRLAVAPRGEDDHVLAVGDVGPELGDLALAIGEGLVERQRAEAERVGYGRHAYSVVRIDLYLDLRYLDLGNGDRNSPRAGLEPPSAGEVDRLAHVAREGGVGHRAGVPRPRRPRRDGVGEVQAPAGAAVIEVGELVDGEGAAETTAQLGVDARGHALERRALVGGGLGQAAFAGAPLVDRGVEAHRYSG